MSELAGYLEETAQAETSPEPAAEAPAPADTAAEAPVTPDPVQEYVQKYGGDTEAALRAAVEAQSLIGRQGQELGAIRQELTQFREQFTPQAADPQYFPTEQDAQNWAEQMGYSDNWKEGAQWALENKSPLYENIMSAAYETNPKEAARFEMIQSQAYQQSQIMNQIGPAVAPLVAQQHRDQFIGAWNELKPSFEDIDALAPRMMEAAQRSPGLLSALRSGDRESQRQVIADLYYIARGQAAAPLATVAGQAAQNAALEAQQLRTAAAVGTATASQPTAPPSLETPGVTEWRSALNEELDNLSGRAITVS